MAKILIVDDDADFVNATRMVLEKEGFEVKSAAGGQEGSQDALEEKPDLVMVTSIANTDYAHLFPTDKYIHIEAFLSKPIDPDSLMKKIRRIIPEKG
jgi:hypothetical protein